MTVKDNLEVAEKALNVAKEGSGFVEKLLSASPTYRANKLLLDEIEHDPNMNSMEKYVIMHNFNKIKKQIMNNTNIYNIADSMLNGKGKSLEQLLPTVDDEWLGMYDDISKNVSSQDMQTVWAKILASKCQDEHSVSKKLLQVLQVMESKDAELFSYLCSHSVMVLNPKDDIEYPLFFYQNSKTTNFYDKKYINYNNLSNLSSLGLINYDTSIGGTLYETSDKIFINYLGNEICIRAQNLLKFSIFDVKEHGIIIGNVFFTTCGIELVNLLYDGMTESRDSLLLNKIANYYKNENYIIEQ